MSPVLTARDTGGKPAVYTVTRKVDGRDGLSVEAISQDDRHFICCVSVSAKDYDRLEPGQQVRVKLETKGAK